MGDPAPSPAEARFFSDSSDDFVDVDWTLTGAVAALAVVGSIIGARYTARISADMLRVAFAWFVLAMGTFILAKELLPILGIGA